MSEVRTKYQEPWFLSNDNDAEEWCITDGVETFPITDASQTEFGLAVKGTVERAAVQQPNRGALRERIIENILLDSNSVDKVEHILEWEPRNPQLLKAHRLVDAILAALPIPATGEVTAHQFDIAAEAFYETPTDPALNEQGNRRKALANALAAIGIEVTP